MNITWLYSTSSAIITTSSLEPSINLFSRLGIIWSIVSKTRCSCLSLYTGGQYKAGASDIHFSSIFSPFSAAHGRCPGLASITYGLLCKHVSLFLLSHASLCHKTPSWRLMTSSTSMTHTLLIMWRLLIVLSQRALTLLFSWRRWTLI